MDTTYGVLCLITPISDTTLHSSTAASCNPVVHVMTQLPS